MSAELKDNLLTAIMPTYNRSALVASQVRLFAATNFAYPLLVADSSDPEQAVGVRSAVEGKGEYEGFAVETPFYDKLAATLTKVKTPFVLLVPDRKITCPHAVTAALEQLATHDDHVLAMGYVLGFSPYGDKIDINRIVFYTPTVGEDDPIERLYHLMRRYQVSLWAVFRREALETAVAQARSVKGAMFQEIMFMNALVLQGKICRLPLIYGLQGPERSLTPLERTDPLYWFLEDARSFIGHYASYREMLTAFVCTKTRSSAGLTQILDVIHGLWLSYNFDIGVMNRAVQLRLSASTTPLPHPRPAIGWLAFSGGDEVWWERGKRIYVWRNMVLNAEPRDEIRITAEDRQEVLRELDFYFDE